MFNGHSLLLKLVCGWFSNSQILLKVVGAKGPLRVQKYDIWCLLGSKLMSLEKVFLSDMKFAKEKSWKDFFFGVRTI